MGRSESLYFGPFFECRNQPSDDQDIERGCVKEGCTLFHEPSYEEHVRFCAACGQPLAEFTTGRTVWTLDWADVSTAVKEALTLGNSCGDSPAVMRWIPNVQRRSPRNFWLSDEPIVLTPEDWDQAAEMAWLDHAFADERLKLCGLYGAENVVTKWGLLRWWD